MFGLSKKEKREKAAHELEKFIVQYVYREIGFIPVHIAALSSEQDFEGAEAALPLFVLWGEEERGDSYSFRTWTNWSKMIEIAGKYDGLTDDLDDEVVAQEALRRTFSKLATVSNAAIYDLFEKSRKRPSQICDEYWLPAEQG